MRHYAGTALLLLVTIVAVLGSYTVNLKVSSERSAVDGLRRQLVADARDMRNLEAELRTRARLPEMQRWNDNVLLMSAPVAGQFVRSPVELASYAAATARPEVQYAVATPDAAPAAAALTAPLQKTAYHPDAAPVLRAAPVMRPAPVTAQIVRPAATQAPITRGAPLPTQAHIVRASYEPGRSAVLRNAAPVMPSRRSLDDLIIDIDLATPSRPPVRAVAPPSDASLANGGQ
jgi:hypothetical protein